MLKCVNLIEIRFYASSFFVQIIFETTAHMPEVEFGGQIRIYEGRTNNQHWLLAIIGHAKANMLQQNMW